MADLIQTVGTVLLLSALLLWLGGVVWWMTKKWPLRYAVCWPVLVWADKQSGGTHGDD